MAGADHTGWPEARLASAHPVHSDLLSCRGFLSDSNSGTSGMG